MEKRGIWPLNKSETKGPYAPAVVHNNIVYVSGQGPVDLATGEIVEGSFASQAGIALENLRIVLEESNSNLENVLMTRVYLVDLANFSEMNSIFQEFFGESKPARTTVQVAALPFNIAFEIDAVAHTRES